MEGLTCLSMHQPWASLVVYGIKRIEGRTWDSNHRGRLWIHAASQEPDPAEIQQLHEFFSQVHGLDGHVPTFPPAYPTGVLLGCVDVADVLPREAVEEWPGLPPSCRTEALSPFCFLCEKPKRLVVPQPIKGDHKLWQLPRALLKVALRGLRDPPGLRPFSWREFGDPRAMLAPAAPPKPAPARGGKGAAVAGAGQPSSSSQPQAAAGSGKGQGPPGPDCGGSGGGGGGAGAIPEDAAEVERRLRAVRKKLRQVTELEAAQRSGGALTPEQVAKVSKANEWRAEMRELEAAAARLGVAAQ